MSSSKTYLTGLMGEGIMASRSPEIHQREARALGLKLVYKTIDFREYHWDVSNLPEKLTAAEAFGFDGLNITHPYKQAVITLLDELSTEALEIGSVNTVIFREGKRIGYNTDWFGFTRSFNIGLPDVATGKVVQVGAGGAGAAVAYALLKSGIKELSIVDIDIIKSQSLVSHLLSQFPGSSINFVAEVGSVIGSADGIVQATPIGMSSHPGMPFDPKLLQPHQWVAEIIYFPMETELLKHARSIGCKTIAGDRMVVYQAAMAFELFTGVKPDVARMFKDFEQKL